ncbi:MAG: hypothetical protein WAL38_36015, partial [Solirubrobacteraceae bacterium]
MLDPQRRCRQQAARRVEAEVVADLGQVCGSDEFRDSERPMCQQFRFASEGQSRSSRLLAERSPECKHRLCRFGGNAVVMSRAAGRRCQAYTYAQPVNRRRPTST